jgi:hypothetical protein
VPWPNETSPPHQRDIPSATSPKEGEVATGTSQFGAA